MNSPLVSLLDLTTATVNNNNNGVIVITGTSGSDSINGSAGMDIVQGGHGNDTINGGLGQDQLHGEDGDDEFVYTNNSALSVDTTVVGGNGTDTIRFTTAIDTLTAGSLDGDNFHVSFAHVSEVERIQLFGASSVNLGDVLPGAGINTIMTGNDNTALRYDATVLGSIGVDATAMADNKTLTLFQNNMYPGNNVFAVTNLRGDVDASGLDGNVSVAAASGSGFAVSVLGGSGNDTISGGAGNDSISGGAGSNSLTGGAGVDVFTISNSGYSSSPSQSDIITDLGLNNAADVVIVNSGARVEANLQGNWTATAATVNNSQNNFFIIRADNAESVNLSQVTTGNGYYVDSQSTGSVIGSAFGDYLSLSSGTATFTGGAGGDVFHSFGNLTVTDLGAGSDILYIVNNNTAATITATVVADWTANSSMFTGPGSISLTSGSAGVDINVSAATSSYGWSITGSTGGEVLVGDDYADTISGGAGADTITGGAGNDSLTGGTGNDTFIIGTVAVSGIDVITDLADTDTIKFANSFFWNEGTMTQSTLADCMTAIVARLQNVYGSTVGHAAEFETSTGVRYIFIDGATNGYSANDDAIVQITGNTFIGPSLIA